ncbi:MAG: methyltransferase domain-containing protein [Sphaerobacter sp.]|nr:methyltransferase domain-containing protein [Sphaerobacter sp.]
MIRSEQAAAPARASGLTLACPRCRAPLERTGEGVVRCPAEGDTFAAEGGIWRFLLPERAPSFTQFLAEYTAVRRAEGRGHDLPSYYRALPFDDLSGRFRDDWRIRAVSYQAFVERILAPLEARRGLGLRILDLGAGNGWLSYRLARRGHAVAAVDLLTDRYDGLGAYVHYDAVFTPVQAEFDRLPFADGQADLVIFNASLHYSADYAATLREALRALRPDGQLVILDSPIYRDARSGEQMLREREAAFTQRFGFPSNSLPSEGFLTYDRLDALAATLGVRWRLHAPWYGWRWALRPWRARLRGHREPARFLVIAGERIAADPANPPVARRSRALRAVWRRGLRWQARLRGWDRLDRARTERVAGRDIVVLPGVFNPVLFRSGAYLAEVGEGLVPPGGTVLDLGTGSGVGAVVAAQQAARVVAVDINPAAVRCARINAVANGVQDRIDVRQGDLFGPVAGERFDLVLFNPPFYRGIPRDEFDRAWRSPDVAERFAAELASHLTEGGCALVVLSSDGDAPGFLHAAADAGLAIEVVAERDLINEVLRIYRLTAAVISPLPESGEGSGVRAVDLC